MLYAISVNRPLAAFFCANGLAIHSLIEESGVMKATGCIDVTDHLENFQGTDDWKAEGRRDDNDTVIWDVQHDPKGGATFHDQSERPMFTCQKHIDDAIESFVKEHLEIYRASVK